MIHGPEPRHTRRKRRLLTTTIVALLAAVASGSASAPAAAGPPDVVLVGDSIVAGNRSLIDPILAERGFDVVVDAQGGRNLTMSFFDRGRYVDSGAAAVRRLREAGLQPDLWVIELGANDITLIRGCECDDPVEFAGKRIDRLLDELPPEANVAWVTTHRAELEPAVTHFNNALLVRSLQQIDWHAAALFRDDWLLDAKHPTVLGATAFAGVLADGIAMYLDAPFVDDPSQATNPATRLGLVAYPTDL